jgi:hypothetical protein
VDKCSGAGAARHKGLLAQRRSPHQSNGSLALGNSTLTLAFDAIAAINQRFTDFLDRHANQEFSRLPSRMRYYPLLEECVRAKLFEPSKTKDYFEACPGPHLCDIPRFPGLKCAIAKRTGLRREALLPKLSMFHFEKPARFVVEHNGCTL